MKQPFSSSLCRDLLIISWSCWKFPPFGHWGSSGRISTHPSQLQETSQWAMCSLSGVVSKESSYSRACCNDSGLGSNTSVVCLTSLRFSFLIYEVNIRRSSGLAALECWCCYCSSLLPLSYSCYLRTIDIFYWYLLICMSDFVLLWWE